MLKIVLGFLMCRLLNGRFTSEAQIFDGFLGVREALGNKVVKRSLRSDLFLMNVLGAD